MCVCLSVCVRVRVKGSEGVRSVSREVKGEQNVVDNVLIVSMSITCIITHCCLLLLLT